MHNTGNYIVSLGNVCRWLGEKAMELGAEVYPGFAAAEVLFNDDGSVKGVATGDMGVAEDGSHKDSFEPGFEFHAKYTIFAEGCRGHSRQTTDQPSSTWTKAKMPQHYGIGIKEIWKVTDANHKQGLVMHSAGWPLSESGSSGGSFLYHLEDNQVSHWA